MENEKGSNEIIAADDAAIAFTLTLIPKVKTVMIILNMSAKHSCHIAE